MMMHDAVIVTGCAGAIGRALCRVFRGEGCHIVGIDRVADLGGSDRFLKFDLAEFAADQQVRARALEELLGALDGMRLRALVNNAAHQVVKSLTALEGADWTATLAVNLLAPFFLTQALAARLERDGGSVVNIGSIHGRLTKPGFAAYAASKAALEALTRSLAVELGGKVRVNAIAPGAVESPMLSAGFADRPQALAALAAAHPAGRIGRPDDIAQAAAFLASPHTPYMTGTVLSIDGAIGSRLHDPL